MQIQNVDTITGAVCAERVHLDVAIPLKISISNFMWVSEGEKHINGL